MSDIRIVDVAVIGAGPAGLAAAVAASEQGASVLLVEREGHPGGILKQCIHDGFGLIRFGERLSGPEYAQRYIDELYKSDVELSLLTFATNIEKNDAGFLLTLVGKSGIQKVQAKALVLATGCRERTARQVAIHGTRPAGVYTAGSAQYYTNILGQMPVRRCVVLGSGDIGLIMARRLTLEGAEVLGVYEAKPTASGLNRNISQCLYDFDIPMYTSKTVTRVFGHARVEAVEISDVDARMNPIAGTEQMVPCDGLILSVGLIPENELAESLGVPLYNATKGPLCDQRYMTMVDGIFSCGNALHVNDLVDYVSESGAEAGAAAANYTRHDRTLVRIDVSPELLYVAPQMLDLSESPAEVVLFFRSRDDRGKTTVQVTIDGQVVFTKQYRQLRPPEMERIVLELDGAALTADSRIRLAIAKEDT